MSARSPFRTPSPPPVKAKGVIDSPFSDYYTDSPPTFSPDSRFTSPFQQKLLNRLTRIGTQVLRRTLSDDASKDIEVGLDALENHLQAPEVKSREPADVADSGLFIDDDDEEDDGNVYDSQEDDSEGSNEDLAKSHDGLGLRMSDSPEEEYLESPLGSVEDFLQDKVLMDADEADFLVKRVTNVANELRKRYEEVKHMNDQMVNRLETASNEVLHLRSENESLRADLSFDHSELLFLKLQLKAVQLSIEPQLPADGQYASSVSESLSDGLERWRKDWKDVDLKFQARRAKYGMADFPSDPDNTKTNSSTGTVIADHPVRTPEELRLPKKIISIRRPMAPRSFTTPPVNKIVPLPDEPPTPSLTSGSESGEDLPEQDSNSKEADDDGSLENDLVTESIDVGNIEDISGSDNDDEVEVEDDDDDYGDEDEDEDDYEDDYEDDDDEDDDGDETSDVDKPFGTPSTPTPKKTPWQELWDGLGEISGMRPDDD